MKPGGQCVMTTGATLMLLWSVGNWDMHILEVSFALLLSLDVLDKKLKHKKSSSVYELIV